MLLEKLENARLAIAQSRSVFVEELNTRLGGNVLVDLSSRDTSLFFDAVDIQLQGSGMQYREAQVSLACESFTPAEFVAIIRGGYNRPVDEDRNHREQRFTHDGTSH